MSKVSCGILNFFLSVTLVETDSAALQALLLLFLFFHVKNLEVCETFKVFPPAVWVCVGASWLETLWRNLLQRATRTLLLLMLNSFWCYRGDHVCSLYGEGGKREQVFRSVCVLVCFPGASQSPPAQFWPVACTGPRGQQLHTMKLLRIAQTIEDISLQHIQQLACRAASRGYRPTAERFKGRPGDSAAIRAEWRDPEHSEQNLQQSRTAPVIW